MRVQPLNGVSALATTSGTERCEQKMPQMGNEGVNVLHVSHSDLNGGAALASYRLHQAMQERMDCASSMLVRTKKGCDPSVSELRLSKDFVRRMRRFVERLGDRRNRERFRKPLSKVELFSDDRGCWTYDIAELLNSFDIVQLHWVCDFLNYRSFFGNVPESVPIVWRLADMNPFTGGCHYDGGCGRFAEACGTCPKLESKNAADWSHMIWKRKKAALAHLSSDRLHIVALNHWMAKQVSRSSLFSRFECTVIPNGVSLEDFYPIESCVARRALGIPVDRVVIAFVADSVGNHRKGFDLLVSALSHLRIRRNTHLLVAGEAAHVPSFGFPTLHVGHIQSPALLRQVYSAADVFVVPSIEDNQPNTVLEAMACGTPVVGFKVDGIPEIVEDGLDGLLVSGGGIHELSLAIEFLLNHAAERTAMAYHARERVERDFSREAQVDRYCTLYRGLTQSCRAKAT